MGNEPRGHVIDNAGEWMAKIAELAAENTGLKRQLAASANAYGSALETIETQRTELQQALADAEACNAATEEVQKEIVRAREEIERLNDVTIPCEHVAQDVAHSRCLKCNYEVAKAGLVSLQQQLAQSRQETENQTSKLKDEISLHHDRVAAYVNDMRTMQLRLNEALNVIEFGKDCASQNCGDLDKKWEHIFNTRSDDPFLEIAATFLAAQQKEKP